MKFALIADDPGVFFTTPHFDGYPAVLVRLAEIGVPELEELITEAWLAQAPNTLARRFLRTVDGAGQRWSTQGWEAKEGRAIRTVRHAPWTSTHTGTPATSSSAATPTTTTGRAGPHRQQPRHS
jgi:hypothetical protein